MGWLRRFVVLALTLYLSIGHQNSAIANDWCPSLTGWFNTCTTWIANGTFLGPGGYTIIPCNIDKEQNLPNAELPQTDYWVGFQVYQDAELGVFTEIPGFVSACYYPLAGNPSTQPLNNAKNNGQPVLCNCAGDPINLGTGNVYRKDEDFIVGRGLAFSRYYNSNSSVTSDVIGQHWRHTYSRSLKYTPGTTPTVVITREDGRATTWYESGTSPTTWGSDPNVSDDLSETQDSNGNPTGWTLFRADLKASELYNANGQLIGIQDLGGFQTTLAYSTAGLLTSVTDAFGRSLSFAYNANSQLTGVSLPSGKLYAYGHDSFGNLVSVTFPDGSSQQYLYNEPAELNGSTGSSLLTGVIDESGTRFETFNYDSSNRAVGNQLVGGVDEVLIAYNSNGSVAVTDSLGNTTTRTFNLTNGVQREASNSGFCKDCLKTSSFNYDLRGNTSSTVDFDGNVTSNSYDLDNNLTARVDAAGTSLQRTVTKSFNSTFHLPTQMSVFDANNNMLATTKWSLNSLGQIVARCDSYNLSASGVIGYSCGSSGSAPSGVRQSLFNYCATTGSNCPIIGLLQTSVGPRTDVSQVTTYGYYANGDLQSVTDPIGHTASILAYDGDGHVTSMKDANGIISTFAYTPRGWLQSRNVGGAATAYNYTAYGAIASITDPDGIATSYTYDLAHRLTRITDALGNYTQYTLDAAGDVTGVRVYDSTGTLHRSVTRMFNALGQLSSTVDGLGVTVFTATTYDANGNLTISADAAGIQRQMGYDALNRLAQTLDNYDGSDAATQNTKAAYTYDGLNRITQITDPSGINTTYQYDNLSEITGQVSPDSGSVARTFDAAGNELTSTDAKGVVRTEKYDATNRLTSDSYADSSQNVTYSYDDPNSTTGCASSYAVGRLTRIIEAAVTTVYCYDPWGHIIQKMQITSAGTDAIRYTVTAAGRLSSIGYPSGNVVNYGLDGDGRVQSVTFTPPGGSPSIAVSGASYLPFGPVGGYTLGNGQAVTRSYDANYRLTDITSPAFTLHVALDAMGHINAIGNASGANPAAETYGYDPLYRLLSINEVGGSVLESLTYNPTGDRLSKSGDGLATGTYTYNTGTHQLTGAGNAARSVDADGNTTAISEAGGTYGFGYSARNRMILAQANSATVGSYTYNALGQRIGKIAASTERFGFDEASHLLDEYGSDNRDYIWLGNIPIALVDEAVSGGTTLSTVAYVTADGLGTPRAVSSSTGAVIWQWPYQGNPFGELAPASNGGYTLNLRYPGQYYDAESGLSSNVFRDYDSTTGRYLQSDLMGLAAGMNTYAYVGGNPLSATDPLGLYVQLSPAVPSPTPAPAPSPAPEPYIGTVPDYGPPANDPVVDPELPGEGSLIDVCASNPIICAVALTVYPSPLGGSNDEAPPQSINPPNVLPFPQPTRPIPNQCPVDDNGKEDRCAALYKSTLATCDSLSGRKKFNCLAAARENYKQCMEEE